MAQLTNNLTESLNTIFELENNIVLSEETPVVIPDDDLASTRENLYSLIHKGSRALDNILEIAKQSESPRCYEVMTSLLKTLADINHQVVDLHEKRIKICSSSETKSEITQNNAFFVGSTSELHKTITSLSKNEA
jgi:hypothetical protein